MKQNQIFGISGVTRYLAGYIIPFTLVFFLGSCCATYPSGQSNKKNCKCSQQELAVSGQHVPEQPDISAKGKEYINSVETIQKRVSQNSLEKSVSNDNLVSAVTTLDFKYKKAPLGIKAINTHFIAGPNMSSVSKKTSGLTKKSGTGFQFGVGSNYVFSKNFSMTPSLLFRQNNFSTSSGSGSYETKYSYNFLSFPVMASFRASDRLQLGGGPEINYLLSATSRTSSSGMYGTNPTEKQKITEQSARLGIGVQADLTYMVTKSLGARLTLNKGLSNLDKNQSSTDYSGGNTYVPSQAHLFFVALSMLFNPCPWEFERKKN